MRKYFVKKSTLQFTHFNFAVQHFIVCIVNLSAIFYIVPLLFIFFINFFFFFFFCFFCFSFLPFHCLFLSHFRAFIHFYLDRSSQFYLSVFNSLAVVFLLETLCFSVVHFTMERRRKEKKNEKVLRSIEIIRLH